MRNEIAADRKDRILRSIYISSWGTSLISQSIVAILEIFMLVYTLVNPALFGQYMQIYRRFYILLLSGALAYIALIFYIRGDIDARHRWLNVVNPVYAAFYFIWALGITHFDAVKYGVVDTTVFMTFSLTVPLSFFLFPHIYTIIVIAADAVMLYLLVTVSGGVGPLINLSIFVIFQIVLGVSFMRLKLTLADRIVRERENAEIDVLTGFGNRRAYEKEVKRLSEEGSGGDMIYVAIDINELKEVNDTYGHEAGDRLIVGAGECIERHFADRGKLYRIGGDEFAVLLCPGGDELSTRLAAYEKSLAAWSEEHGMTLSTACGYACDADCPGANIAVLARIADRKMYEAKDSYYRKSGRDRRRYGAGTH